MMDPLAGVEGGGGGGGGLLIESLKQIISFKGPTKKSFFKS